jgi:protein TonB
MKFFLITLIYLSFSLPSQALQTEKKTVKGKNPNSREVFYVIKGTDIKHGEYSKTLRGIINVSEEGQYENGLKTGVWEYFDSQGQVEQRYDFSKNELVYDKNEASSFAGATKSALIINGHLRENNTGQLPVLLGGMSKYAYYLANNLEYPPQARANQIEGTVIVSVTITADGKIVDEQVEGEAGYGLGEEALRVAKLLPDDWIPLTIDGEPVATRLFIPIRFRLS